MQTDEFIQTQITRIEAMLTAYNDAIIAITTGQIQSYSLNTSQSVQTVTKHNIAAIQRQYSALLSQHESLCARIHGGSVQARPCF